MRRGVRGTGQYHSIVKDHRAQSQRYLVAPMVLNVSLQEALLSLCMTETRSLDALRANRPTTTPMPFSQRTNWNTEETDLARAHRVRLEAGLPIADLTASNPTRCGFTYPASLLNALTDPRALDYDPQPGGLSPRARPSAPTMPATASPSIPSRSSSPPAPARPTAFSSACSAIRATRFSSRSPAIRSSTFSPPSTMCASSAAPLVYDHGWQIDAEGFAAPSRRRRAPSSSCTPTIPPATSPSRGRPRNSPASAASSISRSSSTKSSSTTASARRPRARRGVRQFRPRPRILSQPRRRSGLRGQRPEQDCRPAADESRLDCRHRPGTRRRPSPASRSSPTRSSR